MGAAGSAFEAPADAKAPSQAAPGGQGGQASGSHPDSSFESSKLAANPGPEDFSRWIGWRRRGLVAAVLVGCLSLFSTARWLAATPTLPATFEAGPTGGLRMTASTAQALAAAVGLEMSHLSTGPAPKIELDDGLLHRAPRWQTDDVLQQRQAHQQQAVFKALSSGTVTLHTVDGATFEVRPQPRAYAKLGLLFWPLSGLALLVYLFGVVLLLARPGRVNACSPKQTPNWPSASSSNCCVRWPTTKLLNAAAAKNENASLKTCTTTSERVCSR